MTERRRDSKARLSVICSKEQHGIVEAAAEVARCDMSTWMLAHLMRAAQAQTGVGAPIVLIGTVADQLRACGERQGISAERALAQLLVTSGEAPIERPAKPAGGRKLVPIDVRVEYDEP